MATLVIGIWLFLLTFLNLIPLSAGQIPQPSETLRTRVEHLHEGHTRVVRGVRILEPDSTSHFFQARNFTSAWPDAAVGEILQAIRRIDQDGLTPADYHLSAIESLRATPPDGSERDVDLQILVTDALAALIDHVRYGKVRPIALDRRWNVDPRAGAAPLETFLAEVARSSSPGKAIEALKPTHFIYRGLRQALAAERAIAAAGGWPSIPAGPTLKPGMKNPRVALVRRRLAATSDLAAPSTGDEYDEMLLKTVKAFQERHRLTPDGAIGRLTLNAMNVTPEARVDQLRVNLERARWVVGGARVFSDTFVLVNVPAFKVYFIRDGRNIWEARVQVGRAGRQTPTFRADMRYLVINPDWTVPPTILAKDVLAAMRRGENAIAKKRLTVLDRLHRPVMPDSIDWSRATPANFPYTLRQLPGPDNALGRVKFVFPNEHSIFLHDTPSQELFTADERTFSSGCIRVEHALDFAALLLDGQDDWDPEKIHEAIENGGTETVFLKRPVPVLIVYWTASVGASGELRYARDVYNLDGAVLKALGAAKG